MTDYTEEAKTVCQQIAEDEGIPTTADALKEHFYLKLKEQGSKIANQSKYSPFFTLLAAIVTTPALWLITFMVETSLPNLFLKWATGSLLETFAWGRKVAKKPASKAEGVITFTRESAFGDLPLSAGIIISSAEIDGVIYQVITTAEGLIADGNLTTEVPVIAAAEGKAYNLDEGYYSVLTTPVAGIVQVRNEADWLTQPGADIESDDDLRERSRNAMLQQSSFHTDAAYRAIISGFTGVNPDNIYFDHSAPRGPYTANAYILLDVGEPSQAFLDGINDYINEEGNHGHNDDLLCFAMPAISVTVEVEVTPVANLTEEQKTRLQTDVSNVIRAAFRESVGYPKVTRTQSFGRFSLSRLSQDIHREVANAYSLKWISPTADIVMGMTIARIEGDLMVSVT